jgi:sugar (pentulose or hexulose) kinase
MRHVGVIDIGKTNAKVAVVDLFTRTEVAVETRPNTVLPGLPWPHFDTDGLWTFITDALKHLHAIHRIDGLVVTTHGACAALLDRTGELAAPVLDYEHTGPDGTRAAYDALRPPFAETGSPSLPMGLSIGAQLFWQFAQDPTLRDRTAQIVTWPQYWGYRLTGRAACDVTSLGCHTDLWDPYHGQPSSLIARLHLTGKLAPVMAPADRLGTVLPHIAILTGLPIDTPVLCGIHDSNASLFGHILDRALPFSVVSTGTWVISMAMGGKSVTLDPARDTLVNVNALGALVPSARFMGGREYDAVVQGRSGIALPDDVSAVLARNITLLPSIQPGSGPFPDREAGWTVDDRTPGQTEVAMGYYLALMTAECLQMIGAQGSVIVEGPFARNPHFAAMLATATDRPVITSPAQTGTAIGAALLFRASDLLLSLPTETPILPDPALAAYAARWHELVRA